MIKHVFAIENVHCLLRLDGHDVACGNKLVVVETVVVGGVNVVDIVTTTTLSMVSVFTFVGAWTAFLLGKCSNLPRGEFNFWVGKALSRLGVSGLWGLVLVGFVDVSLVLSGLLFVSDVVLTVVLLVVEGVVDVVVVAGVVVVDDVVVDVVVVGAVVVDVVVEGTIVVEVEAESVN